MGNTRGLALLIADLRRGSVRASVLRRVHAALTCAWTAMIPVAVFTPLRQSVPFLVGISVYALAVGHFSAWQGSRAELAADTSTDDDGTGGEQWVG